MMFVWVGVICAAVVAAAVLTFGLAEGRKVSPATRWGMIILWLGLGMVAVLGLIIWQGSAPQTARTVVFTPQPSSDRSVTQFVLPVTVPLAEFPSTTEFGCTPERLNWLSAHGQEVSTPNLRLSNGFQSSTVTVGNLRVVDGEQSPELSPRILFNCAGAVPSQTTEVQLDPTGKASATVIGPDQTQPATFHLEPGQQLEFSVLLPWSANNYRGRLVAEVTQLGQTRTVNVPLGDQDIFSRPGLGQEPYLMVEPGNRDGFFYCTQGAKNWDCSAAEILQYANPTAATSPSSSPRSADKLVDGQYLNAKYGFSVDIPQELTQFTPNENGDGATFTSADGTVSLVASVTANGLDDTAKSVHDEEILLAKSRGGTVTYEHVSAVAATVSGYTADGLIYYLRREVGSDHIVTIRWEYPPDQRNQVDRWVVESVDSLDAGDLG